MKRLLIIALALFSIHKQALSSHIAGGDFRVEWISGNDFRVTLKLFRDCSSATGFDNPTITVRDNVTHAIMYSFNMGAPVVTPIVLGDECYTPPGICLEQGFYQSVVTLADNPNGYYLAWERCCRNGSIQNLAAPGSTPMTFYISIPDPALQNTTPDFGPYPATGYLCNGVENLIDWNVNEPDGDSLVFTLIDPLAGSGTSATSATLAGPAGTYPFVPINWQTPYNLTNIVGGTPSMSVDGATGVITSYPTGSGVYTFALQCDEYRGGVRISRSIRDIQYYVLPCVFDDFPEIMLPDTIGIAVNTAGCLDIVVIDPDATDTISILVSSPVTFADGATIGMPAIFSTSPDTTYQFYYTDETTGLPDSIVLPKPSYSGGAYFGVGAIGLQYCWQTSCEDIVGNPYILDVAAFSLGCSGDTNFLNQTTTLFVNPEPLPSQVLLMPDTIEVVAREQPCFDIVLLTTDPSDTVHVLVSSATFVGGAVLTQPTPVSTSPTMYEYFYWSDAIGDFDSVILAAPTVSGGAYHGIGGLGFHYCWQTECDDIEEFTYPLVMESFRIGCFGDSTFLSDQTNIKVVPPPGNVDVIPNVFTPNGDKLNDVFRFDGLVNYCYDSITVQVYNRWGQLMFETTDPYFSWDGKNKSGADVPDGAYFILVNGVYGGKDVTRHYPVHVFRNN